MPGGEGREEEQDVDERVWWESFKSAACGKLLDYDFAGSQAELRKTEEIFTLLSIETFAGSCTSWAGDLRLR